MHLEAGRHVVEGVHGDYAEAYVAIRGIPALLRLPQRRSHLPSARPSESFRD